MEKANRTVGQNDITAPAWRRRQRAQRGVTLLEIMIVLVVLLTGIFLAIRVFPTGFGILQSNTNKTLATQLAQQTMGQIQADAVNLPQGVLFGVFDPQNGLQFITQQDPDDLSQYNADPANPVRNPYFSDINKYRYIKGESLKVPLPTQTKFGSGSVYTCKFGPLYMSQAAGDPANPPTSPADQAYLSVYGAPLTGVNVAFDPAAKDPSSYIRDQQTYVIDYGDDQDNPLQIALPPRPPSTPARANPQRTFRVTVTFFNGTKYVTVQTDPVIVPDNSDAVWQIVTINNGTKIFGALSGSEVVNRAFDRIAAGAAWDTNDPYQYQLISKNIPTPQSTTFANVGILAFNPSGANYSETTAFGQTAFTANLDYAVLDWHILHDEREVPTALGNPVPVRTTLGFLKRTGDPEADGSVYAGIFGGKTNDLMVFDLSDPSGQPLKSAEYNSDPTKLDKTAGYYINSDEKGGSFRTGTIYINTSAGTTGFVRPGTKLRVLYRAEGDWGVAIQKAFATYNLATDPNSADPNNPSPSPYPLPGSYATYAVAGTAKQLNPEIRLPLSDFNKSVLVTIQYTTKNGEVKHIGPIQMVASGTGTAPPGTSETVYDTRYAVIPVRDYLPFYLKDNPLTPAKNDGEFSQATSWGVVGALTGVSAKARVIWRDSDAPATKWRVQDIDTYVTQAPQ